MTTWVFTVLTDLSRSKNFLPPPVPLNPYTPFRDSTFIAKKPYPHRIPQGISTEKQLPISKPGLTMHSFVVLNYSNIQPSLGQHVVLWQPTTPEWGIFKAYVPHVVTDTHSFDWAFHPRP